MSQHYNQNYTKEEIEKILLIIKNCVLSNRYIISKNENRQENIDFIYNYNLLSEKQKDILLKIQYDDFCHTLNNPKLGYEHEILYVFCHRTLLYNIIGEEEVVDIYLKFNIIDYENGKKVITISFHKRNKPIDYKFKKNSV